MAEYYVQFAFPEEADAAASGAERRWHTVARVEDHDLAEEMARLAETSFMRATVTTHYVGRVMSRSALKREGALTHAEWELGFGEHRRYGEALRARAARNLDLPP